MSREERFDSFYLATRRDLVLQAFALTGDLPAAQVAVRDAYVAAWHHWRKVSALPDPLAWVRPRAWSLAQRRHTARIWHSNKGLPKEVRAVLDAVTDLPTPARRLLLLTGLAEVPVEDAARETGLTREVAARQLQAGTTAVAEALGVDSSGVRERLLALSGIAAQAALPRPPIVRRAGRKRRQSHTVVAAAAAACVAVVSGAFAHDPAAGPAGTPAAEAAVRAPDAGAAAAQRPTEEVALPALPGRDDLLDESQIARLGTDQEWQVVETHDNTSGPGINTVCQQERFADPDGLAALVRTFEAAGRPRRSAVQTMEVSRTQRQAEQAFDTTLGWYAACHVARLQLVRSYEAGGVGDEAQVLVLRAWTKPVTTYSVAVARIGRVVTSTVGENVGASAAPPTQIAQSLADAVAMLCAASGADSCAKNPAVTLAAPPRADKERGVLAVVDLPPVGRIARPWVGTETTGGRDNPAATACDNADFARAGAEQVRTRTFLIPKAKVPSRFGLTETYGVFGSGRAAERFLDRVRDRMASCEDRELATEVRNAWSRSDQDARMHRSAWDLETEVSERQSVAFRVGFVRVGDKVAQLTFSPSSRQDMSAREFRELLARAGDRLREIG